jgi:formylmethanofuran dehydrogenase subunit B
MKTYHKEDFPNLECPLCNKVCEPVRVSKKYTVTYKRHDCTGGNSRYFSIAENGELYQNGEII